MHICEISLGSERIFVKILGDREANYYIPGAR